MSKEKTGVKINGMVAVNPITGTEIPIFTADYVMMDYGTGAIMAVPGTTRGTGILPRNSGLPIIEVISGGDVTVEAYVDKEGGTMVNSPLINGLPVKEAINKMIDYMEARGIGKRKTDYKMKDWAFNRQRYWANPYRLSTAPSAGRCPYPRKSCPCASPTSRISSPHRRRFLPSSKVQGLG